MSNVRARPLGSELPELVYSAVPDNVVPGEGLTDPDLQSRLREWHGSGRRTGACSRISLIDFSPWFEVREVRGG